MARERGFALAEVLVAAAILATALVTLAQLTAVAMRSTRATRDATVAMVLAAQKMEELRSIGWGVDERGNPVGEPPAGGVEYLDAAGRVVGAGPLAPASTLFCRRWRVQPTAADPSMVVTYAVVAGRSRTGLGCDGLLSEEASLVALKARTAR